MIDRPSRPSDLEEIIAVYGASIRVLAAPFYKPAQLAVWAPENPNVGQWRRRLGPLHTLVAEQDGKIAGFASYESNGHLDFLFTHPDFARQGVATRLYRCIESALRATAIGKIFTEASLAARPFFDRCGFIVITEEIVELRGSQFRRYAMHKHLPLNLI